LIDSLIEIRETKTEWMIFSTKSDQILRKRIEEGLTFRGKRLQNVGSFKYLGSIMTTNGSCSVDIRVRTATAFRVMSDIDSVWKNKNISKETKRKLDYSTR